nr:ATP-dependent sacrificial sulfur transferase LarE [uncultured Holophaga sp.]
MEAIQSWFRQFKKVGIAFSGGVDSSFLLALAGRALGPDRVCAFMVISGALPGREKSEGLATLARCGVPHRVLEVDVSAIPGFDTNPPDRCYHCKRFLFENLLAASREEGCEILVDGTNADDLGDYRPGLRALAELGVESPLARFGLSKVAIREQSRALGIPGWERPALACLATRFPPGQRLTPEVLGRVDAAEELLRGSGFTQCRVRCHGDLARLELLPQEMHQLLAGRQRIDEALKALGFRQVVLDLAGYRMGSMNA